jgi:hypothetical protein
MKVQKRQKKETDRETDEDNEKNHSIFGFNGFLVLVLVYDECKFLSV